LRVGQQAYLDTDRATDEWTQVCDTIPAFEVQDGRHCRRRPPSAVVIQGVRDGKFGDGTRYIVVKIREANQQWRGYVSSAQLVPVLPQNLTFRVMTDDVELFDEPAVYNDGPHLKAGTRVRVIEQIAPNDAANVHVEVLSGSARGRTGWVFQEGVAANGHSIARLRYSRRRLE
jgi:hypothetical protein